MKFFNILVNGRNFLIDSGEIIAKHGFYVLVYVKAENKEDAELDAVQILKGEEKLRSVLKNDKADPPMLFAEAFVEFEKKPKSHKGKSPRTGFAWYQEGEEDARIQSRDVFAQILKE